MSCVALNRRGDPSRYRDRPSALTAAPCQPHKMHANSRTRLPAPAGSGEGSEVRAHRQDHAKPPKNVRNALNALANALERAKRVSNVNSLFLRNVQRMPSAPGSSHRGCYRGAVSAVSQPSSTQRASTSSRFAFNSSSDSACVCAPRTPGTTATYNPLSGSRSTYAVTTVFVM